MLNKNFMVHALWVSVLLSIFMNSSGCCPSSIDDNLKRSHYAPIPVNYPKRGKIVVFQITKQENTTPVVYSIKRSDGTSLRDFLGNEPVYDITGHLENGNTYEHFHKLLKGDKDKGISRLYNGVDSRIGYNEIENEMKDIIIFVEHEWAFALYRFKLDDQRNFVRDGDNKLIFDADEIEYPSLMVFPRRYVLILSK